MEIKITNGELPEAEIDAYVARGKAANPTNELTGIEINVDGEFVDLKYTYAASPFERIRRITGYLVGTLDRFNNGKRAEERDRVKHSM